MTLNAPAAPPTGQPLTPPYRLAKGLVMLTGSVAAVAVLSAVTAPEFVRAVRDQRGTALTLHEVLSLLWIPLILAAFVVFALWMSAIRKNIDAQRLPQSLHRSFAWWGWLIPFAAWVLPYRFMQDLNRNAHASGLGGWWSLYLVAGFTWNASARVGNLDNYVALATMAAVAITGSWLFLRSIVTTITARHIRPPQPTSPRALGETARTP